MKIEKQQFNVYLTPETIKKIKHCSIDAQLSLSDLVEKIFTDYLAQSVEQMPVEEKNTLENEKDVINVQPMLHVENMQKSSEFYNLLGAHVLNGSRDGDWLLLQFGTTELGLLSHPANPEQNEGKVELNFAYRGSLEELEKKLRQEGVTIIRSVSDEGFGYQLQLADPDGLLIKINQIDPDLYR